MTKIILLASCFALAVAASACSQPGATPQNGAAPNVAANSTNTNAVKTSSRNLEPIESPKVEAALSGKDLYTTNCMTCHKDSGKGGKVTVDGKTLNPDDLTSGNMAKKSDEKLYSYISDGIEDEGMPAFKDKLKPDEIKAVVAHLRQLQGK